MTVSNNTITRILIIRFNDFIHKNEIPFFRGAIIKAISGNNNTLFHNHDGETFRYSYPLIQYKRINQKAAILCINEGTDVIGNLLSTCNFTFNLGNRDVKMTVNNIIAEQHIIETYKEDFYYYRIRKWLPFNQENYSEFSKLEGVAKKSEFLEKILIGNILSLTKGLGLFIEDHLYCTITQLETPTSVIFKRVKMMSYDIEFKTNIQLPDFIGIGKGASINYGTLTQIRK